MKRIMIVDDEKEFREGLKTLLEFHGYDVRLAEDGKIGYFYLYSMNFDLIITDILMPEMDGLELILKLKENVPKLKIIAISGGGKGLKAVDYLKLSTMLGADRVIRKPFQIAELLQTIEDLTEK